MNNEIREVKIGTRGMTVYLNPDLTIGIEHVEFDADEQRDLMRLLIIAQMARARSEVVNG